MNDYPENWDEIARGVKEKAGYLCEMCYSPSVPGRILTVHHLNGDKSDCRYQNLVALCQVCHLRLQKKGYCSKQLWLFEPPDWVTRRL